MTNRPLYRLSVLSLLAIILAASSVLRLDAPMANAETVPPATEPDCDQAEVIADYDGGHGFGGLTCRLGDSQSGSVHQVSGFGSFGSFVTAAAGPDSLDVTEQDKCFEALQGCIVTELRDRVRLQAHFMEVDAELRSRDVSHLSPKLQEARTRNLDELLTYREAGEFPQNTYVPHQQPVFIDRDDRRCAVGHLMIESGFEDEARRIAERENLAYLLEMESPEVKAWVAQSGLTAEEAAWIQPSYYWHDPHSLETPDEDTTFSDAASFLLGISPYLAVFGILLLFGVYRARMNR